MPELLRKFPLHPSLIQEIAQSEMKHPLFFFLTLWGPFFHHVNVHEYTFFHEELHLKKILFDT